MSSARLPRCPGSRARPTCRPSIIWTPIDSMRPDSISPRAPTPAPLRDARLWLLGLLAFALAAAVVLMPPIPTPAHLSIYVDQRNFFGVPNFFDVVSNLPLVIVGAWGLYAAARPVGKAFNTV